MQNFNFRKPDNDNQPSLENLASHLASLRDGELLLGPVKTVDALEFCTEQLDTKALRQALLEVKEIYQSQANNPEVRSCCLSLLSRWCGVVPDVCPIVISALSHSVEQDVSIFDLFSLPYLRYLQFDSPEIVNYVAHRIITSADSPRLSDSLFLGILLERLIIYPSVNADTIESAEIAPVAEINSALLIALRQFKGIAHALSIIQGSFAQRAESFDDASTYAARTAGLLSHVVMADSEELQGLVSVLESLTWDLQAEHDQNIMSASSIVEIVRTLKDAPDPEEYLCAELSPGKNSVLFLGLDVYSKDEVVKVAEYARSLLSSGVIGTIALALPGDIGVIKKWVSVPVDSHFYPYDLGGKRLQPDSESGRNSNMELFSLLSTLKPVLDSVVLFDEGRHESTDVGLVDTERAFGSFIAKTINHLNSGVLVIGDTVTGNLWEVGTMFAEKRKDIRSSRIIVTTVSPGDNSDPFEVIGEACQRISRVEPFGVALAGTALDDLPYREFNDNREGRRTLGSVWEGVIAFPYLDDDGDFETDPFIEVDEPKYRA